MVPRKGFDPLISTLKGWRPNLARRPGHTGVFYYNRFRYCQRASALEAPLATETHRYFKSPSIFLSALCVSVANAGARVNERWRCLIGL